MRYKDIHGLEIVRILGIAKTWRKYARKEIILDKESLRRTR